MLPSHSSAGELLNDATNYTECIDNDCDMSNDDDEEDNNAHEHNRYTPVSGRTKRMTTITLVRTSPSKMTVPPKTGSLAARRPSALSLKPINTNSPNSEECALNLHFDDEKETSEVDGRTRDDTQKRITIAFKNIKYSCRGRHFWERGRFRLIFLMYRSSNIHSRI